MSRRTQCAGCDKWFTPPPFQLAELCEECTAEFTDVQVKLKRRRELGLHLVASDPANERSGKPPVPRG